MLGTGRTTGTAGQKRCELIHCKLTPCSGACQKIQEKSCRVEGFDQASYPRQHKELKDLIQILQFLVYSGILARAAEEGCHLCARTRAADTLKRRRGERGEDYYRQVEATNPGHE